MRITTIAPALLLATGASGTALAGDTASAPSSIYGVWWNHHQNVKVETKPCGRLLCGTVVWANPGALHDALVPFQRHGINLTKIESRPSRRKAWEYLFFIDVQGHESEPAVQRALRALEQQTLLCRVLGSYPTTVPDGS